MTQLKKKNTKQTQIWLFLNSYLCNILNSQCMIGKNTLSESIIISIYRYPTWFGDVYFYFIHLFSLILIYLLVFIYCLLNLPITLVSIKLTLFKMFWNKHCWCMPHLLVYILCDQTNN
jgi:hypothetical protein